MRIDDKIVDTTDKTIPEKDRIIVQARKRFEMAENYERKNRIAALDDLHMCAGENHWEPSVVRERRAEGRPSLTVNKLPSFIDQVTNNSRLNKIAIHVHPNGGGSTKEIADNMAGLIRNIEETSNAESAYQTGIEGAANNGFGYFRITTCYSDDSSFEQDIKIQRIKNPFSVFLDPEHNEVDGSDCSWGFVTKMISREEYEVKYPKKSPPVPIASQFEVDSWIQDGDMIRVAEYWVKEPRKKMLYLLSDSRVVDGEDWDRVSDDLKEGEKTIHLAPNPQDPEGQPVEMEGPAPEGSGFPQTVLNPTPEVVSRREVDSHVVMQYLIDGEKIIDESEWAGKYIPLIPVWGKEIIINEERHLRGVIRFAKDPQRMYNFFRTAATETVGLAPKAPYIMTAEQVEGYEEMWGSVGKKNTAYLTYNHLPGVPPPMRQVVTQTAVGEITESNLANDEMKATTSLFDASLGAQGNEISGRAIQARQMKGDIANLVFQDNLGIAVEYAGRQLVDLIPKIYDTERQIMIKTPEDNDKNITVNQAVVDQATGEKIIINDLSLGKYKVTTSTGPSFSTQRMEAVNSMLDFVRVAPEAANLIIDLVAENMDWPGSAKIANRFKKMLPPGIDDEGPAEPPPPSLDDVIKELKAQGLTLENTQKGLEIIQTKQDMTGHDKQVAEAGAQGVLQEIGMGGGKGGGQPTGGGMGGESGQPTG